MVFLLLIFKMLFFCGYGGLAFFSLITRFLDSSENKTKFYLYSLGLGPALATLILYYLLLILPHFESIFYLLFISAAFTIMITINTKAIPQFLKITSSIFKSFLQTLNFKQGFNSYFFKSNNVAFGVLLIISAFGIKNILLTQLPGHDVLEYMVQADIIFNEKIIQYVNNIYNSESGFYYVGLHGWSFPLQVTLEKMVDSISFYGYDLYFKSLTLWYGLILLAIIYYWVKKYMNAVYAFTTITLLFLAKGYLTSITFFHIDSYRMFFFSLSFLFTLQQINKPNFKLLPLLAFVTGISGFSHSLGVIISVILGAGLLFFIQKEWVYKLKFLASYTFLVLLFGGIHYVLDIIYGTGWIFKEIDFY